MARVPDPPPYGTPEYVEWYRRHVDSTWRSGGEPRPDTGKSPQWLHVRRSPVTWIIAGIVTIVGLGIGLAAAYGSGSPPRHVALATPRSDTSRAKTPLDATPTTHPSSPRPTARTTTTKPSPTRRRNAPQRPTAHVRTAGGIVLPDPHRTPGATFIGITVTQVCTPGWSTRHRNVSDADRRAVFASYGISYARSPAYELDHLIPLELGGSNAQTNLWPQPATENDGDGRNKDALEDHLHALVCSGQLALSTAQRAIAANWVITWDRYEQVTVTTPAPATTTPPTTAPPPPPTTTQPPPPATAPPPPPTTTQPPPALSVVHPGAFCTPPGAHGVTDRGTPMVCGLASDGRYRWIAA